MSGLIFALIIFANELLADNAFLSLHTYSSEVVSVGDTLTVDIEIDPKQASLTSASVYLRYDTDLLEIISESNDSNSEITPFRIGSFWEANVYQNSIGNNKGELNYVAVTSRDNNGFRIVSSVSGILAHLRFQVKAVPGPSRKAKVEIEMVGRRQPSYTLLNQPGVRHFFNLNRNKLEWDISPVFPELTVSTTNNSTESVEDNVGNRNGGRLFLLEDDLPKVYNWRDLVDSKESMSLNYLGMSHGLDVEIVVDSLYVKSAPNNFGMEVLELNVCNIYDECDLIKWDVEIEGLNDPPEFVNLTPLRLVQGESVSMLMHDIVYDIDNSINDLEIKCEGTASIKASCGSDELKIESVSSGKEGLTLSATDPDGATTVFFWQITVDQIESVYPVPKSSFHSYRSRGDVLQIDLREYIFDHGSSRDSLVFDIDSSGLIWEWIDPSSFVMELVFYEEGEVMLSFHVEDLEGNETEGLLTWIVEKNDNLSANRIPTSFDSSIQQEHDFDNWNLISPIIFNLTSGESMLIPLDNFPIGIQSSELKWNIVRQEKIRADLGQKFVEISTSLNGKDLGWFELSASDEQSNTETIRVEVQIIPGPLAVETATAGLSKQDDSGSLIDIPDVTLSYKQPLFIPFSEYTSKVLKWTFLGGEGLNVALIDSGVTITAIDSTILQSILLFSATDSLGNEWTDVVRVNLLSRGIVNSSEQHQTEDNVESAGFEEMNESSVFGLPDITINAGELKISDRLDELIDFADLVNVSWEIRGGANVEVYIDGDNRLIINARNALAGREYFVLSGGNALNRYEIPLTININEPLIRLDRKIENVKASTDGFALSSLLIGQAEVQEWVVISKETDFLIENGFLYVSDTPGIYGMEVEAKLIDGTWIKNGFVNIEIGINDDTLSMQTNADSSFFSPIFYTPQKIEIIAGESANWEVVIEDRDSSPDQLLVSLMGDSGGFSLQDSQIFFDGTSVPDTLYVFVEDQSGMTDEIAIKINVIRPEVAPLKVSVKGDLRPDNTIEWKFKTNRTLTHIEVFVDQKKVDFDKVEEDTIVLNPLGISQAKIDFVVRDFEGEIIQLSHDVSLGPIGLGYGIESPDGNFRVEGEWRDSFALIYQDSLGYRMSILEGAAHVFMHVKDDSPSLSFYDSYLWQDLPTEYGLGQIRAIVPMSGWIRVDYRRIPMMIESILQVYPNPFNSNVALKIEIEESEFVETVVFDVLGRRIRDLDYRWREVGPTILHWDGKDNKGRDVSSGVYVFRVESGSFFGSERVMLLR